MNLSPEQRIANRIDVEKVSFDPISILTLALVLALLPACGLFMTLGMFVFGAIGFAFLYGFVLAVSGERYDAN